MDYIRRLAAVSVLAGVMGCETTSVPELDAETSLYALVEFADGVALYPPLGPPPPAMTSPFDATLLDGMVVLLETTDSAGVIAEVGRFTRNSSPALTRIDKFSVYFVNVPAAQYFADPSLAYRFRVLSGGTQIALSDLSGRVFDLLARNPSFLVGVKLQVEERRPTCTDGMRNGGETGVDCGAGCPPCADGAGCASGTDCQNGVCLAEVCQMASCSDGVQNGAESDVDCGGTCGACNATSRCNSSADCVAGVCQNGFCQPPSCNDGVRNGDESGVDCGGACFVPESCNGADDDCNGTVDDGLGTVTCGLGVCQVTIAACQNGQVATCTPLPASAEDCDGVDNDCDGVTDEGCSCLNGQTQACYDGGSGTLGTGECRQGTQTCAGGQWGACAGQVTPIAEQCNGLDDDCDGAIDEDFGTLVCGTGACQVIIAACSGGQPQTCTPNAPTAETCNSTDDDCDGAIDEDLGMLSCGTGLCARTVAACTGGVPGTCVAGTPAGELCNGADDDCDGAADEGNPGGNLTCSTGLSGACAAGTTACTGGAIVCNQNLQPSAEVCDGSDNDCDGASDEGNPNGGLACSTGMSGVCSSGTTACSGGAIVCNQNIHASAETCDNLDNDCDGTADEGNPGGNLACSTGMLGVCSAGTTECTGGAIECNQNVMASAEVCDGADNDCDGLNNEGNPGGGLSCTTGMPGVCSAGTTACSGGAIVCDQSVMASAEVCDGADNDCDGTTDDGVSTIYYQDSDGDGYGAPSGATSACSQPGGYVTNNLDCDDSRFAARPGGTEVCNSLDDNCNGAIDELVMNTYYADFDADGYGNPSVATQACTAPLGYVANGGDCNDSNAARNPAANEVCNAIDDNCSGQVDEGNPGGGDACVTGLPGSCSGGTTACQSGAIVCNQNVIATWYPDDDDDGYGTTGGTTTGCTQPAGYAPSAGDCDDTDPDINPGELESCDGVDNDCDNAVDDNPYLPPTWYRDVDGDGYGASSPTLSQCAQPAGYSAANGDCNDSNSGVSPASNETCNGLDDNCNSVADENNPGGGGACVTGLPGACSAGTTACFSGGIICNQIFAATTEVCDGSDNDCDGSTDEGGVCGCVPGSTQSCYTGPGGTLGVGVCAAGVRTCNGAGTGYGACTGETLPGTENCATTADENCDGVTPACSGAGTWSRRYGSTSSDVAYWVATDSAGNVYQVGSFQGTVNFGGTNMTSAGGYDAFLVKLDPAGTVLWRKRLGSTSTDHGYRVAVDSSDNVIIAGAFNGTVNFGGGNLVSAGGYDIYVAKYDSAGNHVWSRRYGSTSTDYGWGLAVDSTGAVIVSGHYNGTVNFGGGNLASAGGYDIFLLKLTSAGTFVWARRLGSTSTDYGHSVAVDASNAVILAGSFNGTVNFGGGNLVSAGGYDIFVAKYDANNTYQWALRYGSTTTDQGFSVATDGSNVYVTGVFRGSVNFGGGALSGSTSYYQSFLLKLNSSGVHQWSRGTGSISNHDYGYGVAVDRVGNVLFSGYFTSTANFGGTSLTSAGSYDVYVAKLSPSGTQIWAQRFGDASAQYCRGVAVDPSNNVVIGGYFAGTLNLTGTTLTSAGSNDTFLGKYAP